jgi:hypothetical protein
VNESTAESSKETASNTETPSSTDVSSQQVLNKAQTELLDKMLKCMNILVDMASHLNRNIIIDQVMNKLLNYLFLLFYIYNI